MHALTEEQVASRDRAVSGLETRLQVYERLVIDLSLPPSATTKMNDTDIISAASRYLHQDESDAGVAEAAQLLWRAGSAAAHGQRSFAINRANRSTSRPEGNDTVMTFTGDLEGEVGPNAAAVALTLNEAFRLFMFKSKRQDPLL
ncbi:hypothetical protein [Clavibacter michiganensis]|uniref:hypothetical protein n=1 Tax=Clavibacter michiganensis TaxID=28447 RepID=UPI003078D80A